MSRWFRLYDELLDDPKVQRLSGDDFKAWINLLCLASRNDGNLPSTEDIAFALRLDGKKASALLQRLVSVGLLDEADGRFSPHGWNARQYKSDVSTGRVKQFRERQKAVSGNGGETFHETPPETDTETDVPLSKDNGAAPDSDKRFWDDAKAYVGRPSLVGKWVRDYGKTETARAITAAQIERAVDPIPYIEGCFRKNGGGGQPVVPL